MSDAPPPMLDSADLNDLKLREETDEELADDTDTPYEIPPLIRDEVFRLVGNPDVTIAGEFETEGGLNNAIKGKVIVFQRPDKSQFIGFSNLTPDRALEMGIKTPIRNMNATVGFAQLGFNEKLDRYIGGKIGN